MRHLLSIFVGIVTLAAPAVARASTLEPDKPEKLGFSSERLERISRVFDQHVAAGKLPGAVFLVARNGRLAYAKAVGMQDAQTHKPMQSDSIFRIYSMTKPMVTTAAMILMEEGRIELTDPVSTYLPAFAATEVSVPRTDSYGKVTYTLVPADHPATIADLMRHTAGLAYGELTGNAQVKEAYGKAGVFKQTTDFDARDLTPDEEVQRLAEVPLAHQPGTTWEYSLATDVLGRVVEKASGQKLEDFLAARLFQPLGMRDSGFYVPEAQVGRLAEPLAIDPASGKPNMLIDVKALPKNASGGAGGVSTPMDYLRFAEMLLEGGALDGTRILSPTTVRLMTSDQLADIQQVVEPGTLLMGVKGYTFGFGFAVRKSDGLAAVPGSAGEFMWAGAAGTFFWVDPKLKLVAVMMTQAPGPSRPYYRKLFKQLVYAAIVDQPEAPAHGH